MTRFVTDFASSSVYISLENPFAPAGV